MDRKVKKKLLRAASCLLACLLCFMPLIPASAAADVSGTVNVSLKSVEGTNRAMLNFAGPYMLTAENIGTVVPETDTMYIFRASGSDVTLDGNALGHTVTLTRCASNLAKNYVTMSNSGYGDKDFKYPGDMTLTASDGALSITLTVGLEDYTVGVLFAEMGNSYSMETLKAFAIAARSNAVARMANGAVITDTVSTQVYKGWDASWTNVIAAVEATKGMILTRNGQPSEALYSTSNGGQTNIPSAAWSGGYTTWETIKDDPYDAACTCISSAVGYTFYFCKEGADTTNAALVSLYTSAAASVLGVSSSEISVLGFTAVEPFGHAFSRIPEASRQYSNIRITAKVRVGDGDAQSCTAAVTTAELKTAMKSGRPMLPDMRCVMTVNEDSRAILLKVAGLGHGVGMSSAGAIYMGMQGKTMTDIFAFYYSGLTLKTVSYTEPVLPNPGDDPVIPPVTPEEPGEPVFSSFIGRVNVNSVLNIRSGPGTGYSILGILSGGQTVTVTGAQGDWYAFDFDGEIGYVFKDYILRVESGSGDPAEIVIGTGGDPAIDISSNAEPAFQSFAGVVTANKELNVRSAASGSSLKLGTLAPGVLVTVTGEEGNWYTILFGSGEAYVSKTYIQKYIPKPEPGFQSFTGIVTASVSLNVRSGPGSSYSKLGSLNPGVSVTVTGESGSWYAIGFSGSTGYVSKSLIKDASTIPVFKSFTGIVSCASSLNVRSGPGSSYKKLGTLKNGANVTVTGESGTWYIIDFGGKTGYVAKSYIEEDNSLRFTTTANVNLRSGPGTTYTSLGLIPSGTTLTVTEINGIWGKVTYGGKTGWFCLSYSTQKK